MNKQNNSTLHKREYKPKREPIPRTWFLSHGYTKADPRHTNGYAIWLHPETNDVYSAYGIITLTAVPDKKYCPTYVQYLKLPCWAGNMLLARLKYLTFKGEIKEGETIDHIDGNTFNNDIRNLRAIPDSINRRDGGFLRKLRNNNFIVAVHPKAVIIKGYENMAKWKEEHSEYAYRHLRGKELQRVFFGPKFTIVDPDIIMDLDFAGHPEF